MHPKERPCTMAQRRQSERLAVALFDLAWLLPRTVGAEERQDDPLPRSELEVMRLLGRRPGTGVNAIARDLGLQASNVSTTVRSLEARGLVERRVSGTDRRHTSLFLTARAEQARRDRETRWGRDLADVLAQLPPADHDALLAATPALASLTAYLSEE
jgi:DNA-binding MarR family transcriptional regulator